MTLHSCHWSLPLCSIFISYLRLNASGAGRLCLRLICLTESHIKWHQNSSHVNDWNLDELKQWFKATLSQIRSNNREIKTSKRVFMRPVMCPSWEYFNCASCDHSTMDRNTGGKEAIRDVTMSRRTKSSYLPWTFSFGPGFLLISRGKTRPFSFLRTAWSQTSFSTSDAFVDSLFLLSVNNVTLPCDTFRHQCSIHSQQQDSKQPRMQTEGRSFAWASRYRAMTHMWVKKPRLRQSFPQRPLSAGWGTGLRGWGAFINTHIDLLLYL